MIKLTVVAHFCGSMLTFEIRVETNVTSRHDFLAWTWPDLTCSATGSFAPWLPLAADCLSIFDAPFLLTTRNNVAMAVTNIESTRNAKPSLKLGFAEKWRVTNTQERFHGTCLYDISGHSFLQRSSGGRRNFACYLIFLPFWSGKQSGFSLVTQVRSALV